jgi:hypothetical protein
MPHAALARSLLYLFEATTGEETSSFHCLPWTLPVWRDTFGLAPLQSCIDTADEIVDVDGDYAADQYALDGDGFVFSKQALSTLQNAKLKVVTDGLTVMQAERFMNYFWTTWRGDCVYNRPVEFTISSLPAERASSESLSQEGYAAYRDVVLAMLNRRGGVLATVEEVMVQLRVTPAELWKDDRDTNRVSEVLLPLDWLNVLT